MRGVANVEPVTAETALKLGRAAAHVFTQLNPRTHPPGCGPKIVLGKDTRLSGYMLENALVAGITSLGVDVLLIGPLPTPGVAYITRSLRADAGIVLSASHNSYEDNGIKFFRHDGYKLDDEIEQKIEQLVFTGEIDSIRPTAGKIGRATRIDDALGRYVEFAKASFPRKMSLEKMRIAVDVANGAGYKSTPCILRELGAELTIAHNEPNGTNINANCGSTLSGGDSAPREGKRRAWSGSRTMAMPIACCFATKTGEIVDGDEILAIASVDLLRSGQLPRKHAGRHGHEQFRPRRSARRARRQGHSDESRRPLRDRGNGAARSEPRRRTKRPHDLSRFHHDRRRHHQRAANPAHHAGDAASR